jgi:hypothetical protein
VVIDALVTGEVSAMTGLGPCLPATSVRVTESMVGRSFRNANQPTVVGRPIKIPGR